MRRLPVLLAFSALLVLPALSGRATTMPGLPEDNEVREEGDRMDRLDKPGIRVGGSSSRDSGGGRAMVVPFRIPDLGSVAAPFTGATFHFHVRSKEGPLAPGVGINLEGLPARTLSDVLVADYATPARLIQSRILGHDDTDGHHATDADGGAALAAWLNAQYAGGANAGKHVFLRLIPAQSSRTREGYNVTSANAPDASLRPRIDYNTAATASPAASRPAPASADLSRLSVEELTAPALVPPTVNTSPLPEYGYDRLDYGMTIGIERTPGGRLWACWVGGGDNDKAFFVLATSDDDGATWSAPRAVLDPHDDSLPLRRRTVVGNLWIDPKGRLWLFFDQSMGMFDGRAGSWFTICENPDGDRPVWSAPVRIWHGMTLNKPTVLSNGEWILPISLWQRHGISSPLKEKPDVFPELDRYRMANVFASRDEGRTWERRGGVAFPQPRFDEHMFIERRDGSLWMTARTRAGLWESTSTDGGRTWSEPAASPIKTASARHFIRRLASGNLLLVKHGEKIDEAPMRNGVADRSHLTAFLSEDDGMTWKGGLVLDARRGVTYPDGFQSPDGTIHVSWDYARNTAGEILMARFTETDILARAFIGPRSRTGMLISRPNPEAVAARRERERAEKVQEGGGA